jgi:hypothetical protein
MRSAQQVKPAEVMQALTALAESIGYAVAVHPGPRGSTADVIWEIRTVTINSELEMERQASELVNLMALIVEQQERAVSGQALTYTQEALVVDTIAARVAAHLGLPAGWSPSGSLISAFGEAGASRVGAAADLIRRVSARIEAYVFIGS